MKWMGTMDWNERRWALSIYTVYCNILREASDIYGQDAYIYLLASISLWVHYFVTLTIYIKISVHITFSLSCPCPCPCPINNIQSFSSLLTSEEIHSPSKPSHSPPATQDKRPYTPSNSAKSLDSSASQTPCPHSHHQPYPRRSPEASPLVDRRHLQPRC